MDVQQGRGAPAVEEMFPIGVDVLETVPVERSRESRVPALGRPDVQDVPGQGLRVLAGETVDRVTFGHVQLSA